MCVRAGHERFFISNLDTRLRKTSTAAAIARHYPGATITKQLTRYESAISVAKAEKCFGWVPVEQWREAGAEGLKGPADQMQQGEPRTQQLRVWTRRQRLARL